MSDLVVVLGGWMARRATSWSKVKALRASISMWVPLALEDPEAGLPFNFLDAA